MVDGVWIYSILYNKLMMECIMHLLNNDAYYVIIDQIDDKVKWYWWWLKK